MLPKTVILKGLKAQGLDSIAAKIKSVKKSVYSMGSSLDIKTLDLTPSESETLRAYVKQFQYGTFDGMTDYYDNKPKDQVSEVMSFKYVHVVNEFSPEKRKEAEQVLADKYGVTDDLSARARWNIWYSMAVHRALHEALT